MLSTVPALPVLDSTPLRVTVARAEPFNVKVIRRVGAKYRLPKADIKALIILARRESGYSNRCVTGSHYGLFQLSGTATVLGIHKGHCGRPRWKCPEWNTYMAIKQIRHRYKTPRRALAHSYRYGWY